MTPWSTAEPRGILGQTLHSSDRIRRPQGVRMTPGHRWGVSLAAAATTIALVAGSAATANAAPPTVPAIDLPAGNSGDSSFIFEYGAPSPPSRLLTIGSDTTRILFDPPFGPAGPEMFCKLVASDGTTIAERLWEDDWWSTDHGLDVPAGAISDDGALYTASCVTQMESRSEARWTLVGDAGAPAELTLNHSAEKATRITERDPLDGCCAPDDIAIAPGERIRIRGSAGIWFPLGSAVRLEARIEGSSGGTVPAEQVSATSDGSVLGLTIPSGIAAAPGDRLRVFVESTSTVSGGATSADQVLTRLWNHSFVVAEKQATTTALTLDRRYALTSRTAVNARVVVTDPAGGQVDGTVTLIVDGRSGPATTVVGTGSASAVLRLPALSRGPHTVVAVFGGSERLLGSTSPTRQVRILL
ncbi:Ig-like domain-containing protein [Microbacterium sp. AZCO]|uniref:Ig-like domain-containing protein n=1 Tax=Microbacterium sp. AZCO TaxID=3142976 RepID=UPI0031F34FEC